MLVVKTTLPTRKAAEKMAGTLVRERLAACASVQPCKSFFSWKGRLRKETEFSLELRTKNSNYQKLEKRLLQLHPYSLPQVLAFEIRKASKGYSGWVEKA